MIKLVGAIMTGASCGYFGLRMRHSLKTRRQSLADIISSLELLAGEIRFGKNRLVSALEHADRNGLFSRAARDTESLGAKGAWVNAVNEFQRSLCLTEADCDALLLLGEHIGRTDLDGQLKSIEYVRTLITAQYNEASEEYNTRAKLYSGGGVLIGAMIVIILM